MRITNFVPKDPSQSLDRFVRPKERPTSYFTGWDSTLVLTDRIQSSVLLFRSYTNGSLTRLYLASLVLRRYDLRYRPLRAAMQDALPEGDHRRAFKMTSFVEKDPSRAKKRTVRPRKGPEDWIVELVSEENDRAWLSGVNDEFEEFGYKLVKGTSMNRLHDYPDVHDTFIDTYKHLRDKYEDSDA